MPLNPLPAIVDAAAAHTLKAALLTSLERRESVALNAAEVERIGTPGLQLLWSAAATFQAAGLDFTLSKPSHAFLEAIDQAALEPVRSLSEPVEH